MIRNQTVFKERKCLYWYQHSPSGPTSQSFTHAMQLLKVLCVSDSIMENEIYPISSNDKIELGQGTFPIIARAKGLNTISVLKRIRLGDTVEWMQWTRQYVEGEVEELKAINHKNVVKLNDVVINDRFMYLFVEYCELGSLQKFVTNEDQLTEITTISFMKDVTEAVRCIHEKSSLLIHCDVNPNNLLVVKDSSLPANYTLKITDVGLAQYFTETRSGSQNWMAPEVWPASDGNIKYQTESDVFSTGLVDLSLLDHKPGKPLEAAKGKYHHKNTSDQTYDKCDRKKDFASVQYFGIF